MYEVNVDTVTDHERASLEYYIESIGLSHTLVGGVEFIDTSGCVDSVAGELQYWLERHNISFIREMIKCYDCLHWTKEDRCTVHGICLHDPALKDKFVRLENKERMEKIIKELKEKK